MNHNKLFLILIGVVLSAGLAGCAVDVATAEPVKVTTEEVTMAVTQPTVAALPADDTQPTAELQPTVAVSETQPAATPTIDVDALIREKLSGHHSIDRVYAAEKTREEWNATLDRMIGYGAKISEEEKLIIIDYLLSR